MIKIYVIAVFILFVCINTGTAQQSRILGCEVVGWKVDESNDNLDSTIYEKTEINIPTYEKVLTLFNRPLLNMVFFDNNSSDISRKHYTILTTDSAKIFTEDWLNFRKMNDGIEAYRDVLNIIARRFLDQENEVKKRHAEPTDVLFIFGYNNGVEAGQQDAKLLSEKRARSVFNYFRDVWGIDTNRMKIIPGDLPPNHYKMKSADSTDKMDSEADNRCVIISASQDINTQPNPGDVQEGEIFKFIETKEVEKSLKYGYRYPQYLMFMPRVLQGGDNIRNFEFKAVMNGKELMSVQGDNISDIDTIPRLKNFYMLDLAFGDQDMFPDKDCYINYTFEVQKKDGTLETLKDSIEVRLSGIEKENVDKTKINDQDYKRRTYWSQLFNYNDKSLREVDKQQINKIVNDGKNKLFSDKTLITIEGYTDRMGNDEVNLKLSDNRVRETQKEFDRYKKNQQFMAKYHECRGYGENARLSATNSTPAGRAYNRTVRIRVQLLEDDYR